MKFKIEMFSILFVGVILYSPLVLAGAGDINVPPTNPPFVESVSDEVLDKIKQYVINYSGISEDYFNAHYEILNAYKTTFDCGLRKEGYPSRNVCKTFVDRDCFNVNIPLCNNTYAVHVLWKFNIGEFSAIVGGQSGAVGIFPEEPDRFVFIIEDGEVIKSWSSNQASSLSIPKFREVNPIISKSRLDEWVNGCGEFTDPYGLKLTPKSSDSDVLSFVYYGWGKKDNKHVEFFADLETGENYCNEIMLVGGQKTGVITSTNYTNLILIIAGIIVILLIIFGLYKKLKK
jgi:hypothetical protein